MNITDPITTIITHDNCADGLASAMILRYVYPGAEVIFCQYGTEHHRTLEPRPGALFVDMTPTKESAKAWAAAGAYCLDHHVHAQDIVAEFGERGLFDNARSGARLAFDEVYAPRFIPLSIYRESVGEFAQLISVRDLWLTHDPEWPEAQALHRALMSVHRSTWLEGQVLPTVEDRAYGARMAESEILLAKEAVARDMVWFYADGCKCGVCSSKVELSSAIGEAAREEGADLTACFFLKRDPATGEKSVVYSMRSSERLDCGAFAKSRGGGGHARAAAYSEPVTSDPWEQFEKAVTQWLQPVRATGGFR